MFDAKKDNIFSVQKFEILKSHFFVENKTAFSHTSKSTSLLFI